MNAIEVVKRYIDAWNRHDADAIVALFVEGGTYMSVPEHPLHLGPDICVTSPLR
jgi:ketosteroid isomerase-like protein